MRIERPQCDSVEVMIVAVSRFIAIASPSWDVPDLVAFPFSVRYLAVAHFLLGAARFNRVLDRRHAVFLLRYVSIIIEVRKQEVEEHRVW